MRCARGVLVARRHSCVVEGMRQDFLQRTGVQMSLRSLHTATQPLHTLQAGITGSQDFASGKTAEAEVIDQKLLRDVQEIGTVHPIGV